MLHVAPEESVQVRGRAWEAGYPARMDPLLSRIRGIYSMRHIYSMRRAKRMFLGACVLPLAVPRWGGRCAARPPARPPPRLRLQGIKRKLEAATTVSEKRMKLLGLKGKGGKPAGDADMVADLLLKPGSKVMMMGQVGREVGGHRPGNSLAGQAPNKVQPGSPGAAHAWATPALHCCLAPAAGQGPAAQCPMLSTQGGAGTAAWRRQLMHS